MRKNEGICELSNIKRGRVAGLAQISGFSNINVATINTCFNAGNAIGMVLGGILGDLLSKRFRRAARPLINQTSMLVVAPLNLILYKVLPGKWPLFRALACPGCFA